MTTLPEGQARAAIAAAIALFSTLGTGTAQVASVSARAETQPVPSSGDAADDMVVWVHPTDPALSTVIGTDKHSGIAVYDLAGNQLQFLADGNLNNVDLRYGFPLGPPAGLAVVTSGERSNNVLAIYVVDPNTRLLHNVAARTIGLGFSVYGCCMYHSHVTGDYYFFGTSQGGQIEQWRLVPDAAHGVVDAVLVRTFQVGSISEGCVADDENGWFFVSEENVGIWRYGAEPGAGTARVLVDSTGAGGHLTADVEGLSMYYAAGGGGYLLASSQGSSTFVVYDRVPPHPHVLTFQIAANNALGIDPVTGTDGIDVMNMGLGNAFPGGVFVAQDDDNAGLHQNFKLVSWSDIAAAATPPLLVDATYDVHEARCDPASWAYRNGSGVNRFILTNLQPPGLGTTWAGDLDCRTLPSGIAALYGFGSPGAGTFLGPNEILVDPASPFVLAFWAPQSGNVVRFTLPIPNQPLLCDVLVCLQGACFAPTRLVLSNAIDLTIDR